MASSHSSILADEKFVRLDAIRQSATQTRVKEVTLLTPVLLDSEDLRRKHQPLTLTYNLGTRFHSMPPLPALATKTGGMIIQMPLEGIQEYLSRVLQLEALQPDESLITNLNELLGSTRVKPLQLPPRERLELDLRSSRLFEVLEETERRKMIERLRELPDVSSNPKTASRKLQSQLNAHEVQRLSQASHNSDFAAAWVSMRASKTQSTVRKRDVKRFEKEAVILERYMQGEKPRLLAKEFEVTPQFVSRTVQLMKKRGLEALYGGDGEA